MVQIGKRAPDFRLFDTDKNLMTLDSYSGKKLLLFFFPMAWTGVCTKQVCSLQEDFSLFEELNVSIVGVSVDTIYALKRYREDYHLDYQLLSDFNKEAIRSYDIVHHEFSNEYRDVSKRASFVIDSHGILQFAEVLPRLGEFPNMEAIKAALMEVK